MQTGHSTGEACLPHSRKGHETRSHLFCASTLAPAPAPAPQRDFWGGTAPVAGENECQAISSCATAYHPCGVDPPKTRRAVTSHPSTSLAPAPAPTPVPAPAPATAAQQDFWRSGAPAPGEGRGWFMIVSQVAQTIFFGAPLPHALKYTKHENFYCSHCSHTVHIITSLH